VGKWLSKMQSEGCGVFSYDPESHPCHEVAFPIERQAWQAEIEALVRRGDIEPDWYVKQIEQRFTKDEVASAPLFWPIHTGKTPDVPNSKDGRWDLTCVTRVDGSRICNKCGVGGVVASPLRIPAGSLNKLSKFARLDVQHDQFLLISEELAESLSSETGADLPLKEIEATGGGRLKMKWFQLDPQVAVPVEAIRDVRFVRKPCPKCGAIFIEQPTLTLDTYHTIEKRVLDRRPLPPVVNSPFWEGSLDRAEDGTVRVMPWRRVWFRGDLGRVLMRMKVPRLELTPIIYT
jgi:predicted nucleic-acid-binding Zn-ribbon protein